MNSEVRTAFAFMKLKYPVGLAGVNDVKAAVQTAKATYRKLQLEWHPDKNRNNPETDWNAKTAQLNNEYAKVTEFYNNLLTNGVGGLSMGPTIVTSTVSRHQHQYGAPGTAKASTNFSEFFGGKGGGSPKNNKGKDGGQNGKGKKSQPGKESKKAESKKAESKKGESKKGEKGKGGSSSSDEEESTSDERSRSRSRSLGKGKGGKGGKGKGDHFHSPTAYKWAPKFLPENNMAAYKRVGVELLKKMGVTREVGKWDDIVDTEREPYWSAWDFPSDVKSGSYQEEQFREVLGEFPPLSEVRDFIEALSSRYEGGGGEFDIEKMSGECSRIKLQLACYVMETENRLLEEYLVPKFLKRRRKDLETLEGIFLKRIGIAKKRCKKAMSLHRKAIWKARRSIWEVCCKKEKEYDKVFLEVKREVWKLSDQLQEDTDREKKEGY